MLHFSHHRALIWSLVVVLALLSACGNAGRGEVATDGQTSTIPVIETEPAVPEDRATTQPASTPTQVTVESSDCTWNVAQIIGHWENERGEQYEFTEAGNYYYKESTEDAAAGGTWGCAVGEEPAIILTAGYWRGNSSFDSESAVHIRHRIILEEADTLSLEKAPILTGVYDEYHRMNE